MNSCKKRIAIPMHGKMSTRTFHTNRLVELFKCADMNPRFYISPLYYNTIESKHILKYGILHSDLIDQFMSRNYRVLRSVLLRYFCTLTESADLRFREHLENDLYQYGSIIKFGINTILFELVRKIPNIGKLLLKYEKHYANTDFHKQDLADSSVDAILAPAVGNFGFLNEMIFAREAIDVGLPVFSVITNYDNLVNKGYRGYMPTCLAVWSEQMADDAMRLHDIPASRIEVVGAVQYDTFLEKPGETKAQFIRKRGLDPKKKTILYAASANMLRMVEFYNLIIRNNARGLAEKCNIIIRVYPFPRVLTSPEWIIMRQMLMKVPGVYISDPLPFEVDELENKGCLMDLSGDKDTQELHALLNHSDVMVNYYSTISLEGAICDIPTIHIDYDSFTYGKQYKQRIDFLRRMTHNKRPARLKAAEIVQSSEELLDAIERYIDNPSLHREERYEYATLECGHLDGKAGERLVEMIRSRLN